jgi:phosphotriesterase-related protein
MPIIRTVSGDVDPMDIGITTMHEHILSDLTVWYEDPKTTATIDSINPESKVGMELLGSLYRNPTVLRDNLLLDDEDLMVHELAYFRAKNGDCIVDCTNVGMNPKPLGLRRVANRARLHVVAGCGFYVERSHPEYVATESIEALADRMISAITDGIDRTDVKAGIIGEIATSTLTPQEVKVLQASAQASLATGAAISIHTELGCREGERIVNLLTDEGVRPDRIIVGHMDENLVALTPAPTLAYLDYHRRVLDLGAWVQYDTFGSESYYDSVWYPEPRDTERAAALGLLISDGYIDQLLVGQDIWLKSNLRRFGGFGYDHIIRVVPKLLGKYGVTSSQVDALLIHNPRRALALPT